MTRLYLVRHGETDWNVEHRYQGWTDIPLNAKGREQAKQVAQSLSNLSFQAIYASTLKRAIETAEAIAEMQGVHVETHDSLKEIYFGTLEGKTLREVYEEHIQNTISSVDSLHAKIVPDQESGFDVSQRALPTLVQIAKKHQGKNVLVVTHGGVLHSLLVTIAGMEWGSFHIENGQILTFAYDQEKLTFLEEKVYLDRDSVGNQRED